MTGANRLSTAGPADSIRLIGSTSAAGARAGWAAGLGAVVAAG
jgi:hypothetical protein